MKDDLKRLLDPGDDGSAFTEAVLIKASGALYRRRAGASAMRSNARDWLEAWARPWLVAALIVIVAIASLPLLERAPKTAGTVEPAAEASVLTAPQPEDLLTVSLGN